MHLITQHIPKGADMYTPQTIVTAFIAGIVVLFLQNTTIPSEVQSFEGTAGLYAFLFLVFKELVQFVLKFRKDPISSKLEINTAALNSLATNVNTFIVKLDAYEEERAGRMKDMKPAIQNMSKGIATLVERTKDLKIKNKRKKK